MVGRERSFGEEEDMEVTEGGNPGERNPGVERFDIEEKGMN